MKLRRRATLDAATYCTVCNAWSKGPTVYLSVEPFQRQDVWLCLPCVRHVTKRAAALTKGSAR